METSIGVNLRVTAHSTQGGRKYMEDMFCVAYQPTSDERDLLYAYFGIFDGHGGKEAALYAKQHLMDQIVSQKNFWSDDDTLILKAIRDGFINTHFAMWKELDRWPKTPSGLPSTSGTTASIAFVRRGKLYIGHVGDSAIALGYQDPVSGFWKAAPLTIDHKPEGAAENARILKSGGKVISKSGVPRVVWNRPRIGHKGPVRRSTTIDEIPFLAVARSLGDLWSYNSAQDEFVVSPVPDVSVVDIDIESHRCLILGSDGLWNMLNAQDAVNSVYFAEKNNERQLLASPSEISTSQVKNWINPSKRLVDRALDRWMTHNLRADNTSVVTVVIDPPGPPKAQVIRQNQKNYEVRESTSSVTDPNTSKTVPAMILAPSHGQGKPAMSPPSAPCFTAGPSPTTNRPDITTCPRTSSKPLIMPRVAFVSRPANGVSRHTSVLSKPASVVGSPVASFIAPVNSASFDQPSSTLRNSAHPQKRKFESGTSPSDISSVPSSTNLCRNQIKVNFRTPEVESVKPVVDDVQIHEISSSSETPKTTELRSGSDHAKRRARKNLSVTTEVIRRGTTARTRASYLEPPAKLVKVSTTMKKRSSLITPKKRAKTMKSLASLKMKSTTKKSVCDFNKDRSLSQRSLRSSLKDRIRVTRSMRKSR